MNNAGLEGTAGGFRLTTSERAVPGGDGAMGFATLPRFQLRAPLDELTPSAERRSLLLTLEPQKEKSPWECNRYRIGH